MSRLLLLAIAALWSFVVAVEAHPHQPTNPVIGAFTNPLEECPYAIPTTLPFTPTQCAEAYNTRWLQQQGVRVVPFAWNLTDSEQDALLSKVNGVIIPGGGINRPSKAFDAYYSRLSSLVRRIWHLNHVVGDPVFLWATCYGFELTLSALSTGGLSILRYGFAGMEPAMLPVAVRRSSSAVILQGLNRAERQHLTERNSTLNWHTVGVPPDAFANDTLLRERLSLVGTSTEPVAPHRVFSAVVEPRDATRHNIFASQFHPSRIPFEFANDAIGHSAADIQLSRYFASFVARRLRMNNHSFPSADDVNRSSIDNFPSVYVGWGVSWYWLP
jgi:gamma-glutamyl hydrolase